MELVFLVEEETARIVLDAIVPRIVGDIPFHVHCSRGKQDLLRKLPHRLAAYQSMPSDATCVVVLIDEDRQDCHVLKATLEEHALKAGFATKSSRREERFRVLNRIAVEELEAWFFGDIEALTSAYPHVPRTLHLKRGLRDPDAIKGGTWEALERVLMKAGYHKGGLQKIRAAREVTAYMDPARNQSHSFQVFMDGLRALINQFSDN
ncbi:MAG TPA: DUF4276 family protein [Candidatus Hydrogenedentes bacterium]|nr:DUF4276 family protein [Candidatus Hydrogenedentota bacterium]HPG67651.1 DUF4276 family protein [Candidatus Hydrogenedentota bacterium]